MDAHPGSRPRIAYQGEPGAYSEAAALRFRPDALPLPSTSFEDVFGAVQGGQAEYGVLPIENSIGGTIHRNYDLLLEHDLPIVGEVELRVVHSLLALPGTKLADVRRIHSHPQALAQCERFLRSLPGVEVVATYDTAGSAKMIRDGGLGDAAAVASERAAQVFGLAVLRAGIEDFPDNITRFLVVAADPSPGRFSADVSGVEPGVHVPAGWKTTIVFAVPDEPGALFRALSVFALRGIDLSKLESRPMRGRPWEYLFYADLGARDSDPRCARALANLAEFATLLRTLGSYPCWGEADATAAAPKPTTDLQNLPL